MIPRLHDKHYSRDLKIAVIFSLSFILLLFLFFPKINKYQEKLITIPELFSVQDIPITRQPLFEQGRKETFPKIPAIQIADITEQPEMLNDAAVESNESNAGKSAYNGQARKYKGEVENFSFMPRQIKEVLPKKTIEEVKGYIKVSLMIGKNGKVERYKIISNTTNNRQCLENVITAVFSSRWQIAEKNGQKIEYWVEKIYNFK